MNHFKYISYTMFAVHFILLAYILLQITSYYLYTYYFILLACILLDSTWIHITSDYLTLLACNTLDVRFMLCVTCWMSEVSFWDGLLTYLMLDASYHDVYRPRWYHKRVFAWLWFGRCLCFSLGSSAFFGSCQQGKMTFSGFGGPAAQTNPHVQPGTYNVSCEIQVFLRRWRVLIQNRYV